jgi:pimeloyl-ACP methyl ester carboxylesterase
MSTPALASGTVPPAADSRDAQPAVNTVACSGIDVPAECGYITVPLDRAHPAAGTTRVAFALLLHRDTAQPSSGTIVYNPGGPGLTTISQADALAQLFGPVLDRRDVLLFDMRGTGLSDPLSCSNMRAGLAFAPTSVFNAAVGACGRELGDRVADYGTDAVAADIDDLRSALGIGQLDLWGESYGTYLMQVYAALYPSRVRSVVLSGPIPLEFGFGIAQAGAARDAIGLVCARNGDACRTPTVLADLQRLGSQLDRHPVHFTAQLGGQRFSAVLDQAALADVVSEAGNDPESYGRIPAAATSALAGDYAPLEQMLTGSKSGSAFLFGGSPAAAALAGAPLNFATSCHDYPRVFSYADPPAVREKVYQQNLAALDPADFYPFTATAWNQGRFPSTADCIDWPDDPTARSPLAPGTPMPRVPVLVIAGDLDGVTPVSFGRQVAARFPDSRLAVVPNVGHVPTQGDACAANLGLGFVATLTADVDACAGTGAPPPVTGVSPLTAAGIQPVPGTAPAPQRQAVGLILAATADLRNQFSILGLWGSAAGLRGGVYTAQPDGSITLRGIRVVDDAAVDGAVTPDGNGGGSGTLTLSGTGVANGTLTVTLGADGHGHAVGTLAGAPVDIQF